MPKFSVRDGTARPRSESPSRTSISSEAGWDLERYLQAAEAAVLEPKWRASESAVVEEEVWVWGKNGRLKGSSRAQVHRPLEECRRRDHDLASWQFGLDPAVRSS